MDIRPILSTLARHKTAAALIVLEIALSCAIICNALFLISERIGRMQTPSGVAESEVLRIAVDGIETTSADIDSARAQTHADLAALRAIPGVRAASVTSQVPLGNSGWNSGVSLTPDAPHSVLNASNYLGDEQLVDALGLQLIAGRQFTRDDLSRPTTQNIMADGLPMAIVTRGFAEKVWPGVPMQEIVGKEYYSFGDTPTRVVGVVERLLRPNQAGGPESFTYSMILPIDISYQDAGNYVLRVDPARRAEVLKAAVAVLERNSPNRVIGRKQTFEEIRARYFRQDKAMVGMLVLVCSVLLVVTALGIVGLASFWVQQRTRQIGIRRALGATRRQILHYFQLENFLLAAIGIGIGMLLAYSINLWLMSQYELPRLPLYYLPIGAAVLWLLGQIAVLGPALRAAAVPPATATRSA